MQEYIPITPNTDIAHTGAHEEHTDEAGCGSLLAPQPTSVIIPALNEAENIAQLLLRLHQTMTSAAIPYEAIVVDDRSSDATAAVVEATARDYNLPVRALTKQGPPGKSYALLEGFAAAQFDV